MNQLRSWWALMRREYLEHRIAFLYFPAGILALMALAAISAFGLNRVRELPMPALPAGSKIFELGYLIICLMWFFYLAVTLLFYFGDAFAADRRNNAMLFWKSMPVSDLKVLFSKALTAFTLFPLVIVGVAAVSGLMFYLLVAIGALTLPALVMPDPLTILLAFANITLFALGYVGLALLWYAPFLAWVGGLSTVFGRWSLPLAFVLPGLAIAIENVAFFGQEPSGGYIWGFLKSRWQFGLNELDTAQIFMQVQPFSGPFFLSRLSWGINWPSLVAGLAAALIVLWLASEWRRRRVT